MQPIYGAALIYISYEFLFIFYLIFLPILNNSVLFTSYLYIFLLVVVFVFFAFLHSSIACHKLLT